MARKNYLYILAFLLALHPQVVQADVTTYTFDTLANCTTGREANCQSDNGIELSAADATGFRINTPAHFGNGVFAAKGAGLVCGSGEASGTGPGYVDEPLSARTNSACINIFTGFFGGWMQNYTNNGNHSIALKYSTDGSANCQGYISLDFEHENPRVIVEPNNVTCGGNNPDGGNLVMNIGSWLPKNNQQYWVSLCAAVNTAATGSGVHDGNGTVALYVDGVKVLEHTDVNMRGDSASANFDSVFGPRAHIGLGVPRHEPLICFDHMILETGTTTPQGIPASSTQGSGDGPYWYAVAGDGMEQMKLEDNCSQTAGGSRYVTSFESLDWREGPFFVTSPDNNDYACNVTACPSCTTSNSLRALTEAADTGAGVFYTENAGGITTTNADGAYAHGHIYLDSLPGASMALTGFAKCDSYNCTTGGSAVNNYLALTVTNGKWGLLPKTGGSVGTAHESTATAAADTWTEFELAVNDDNECSLAIEGTWVINEVECNQDIAAWLFDSGFRFIVAGIIDTRTVDTEFIAYIDDFDAGGASFWSTKGWDAASAPSGFPTGLTPASTGATVGGGAFHFLRRHRK